MGSISRELEFWFEQLERKEDSSRIIQAIDRLAELKHPEIEEILFSLIDTRKDEKIRIKAIQTLKKINLSDSFRAFNILKYLLLDENKNIRRAILQAIVDLDEVKALKYLTQYYYSSYSKGVKTEVMAAINDLSKILEEKKQKKKININQKKITQKKLIDKPPKKVDEFDYKEYIKKFFE